MLLEIISKPFLGILVFTVVCLLWGSIWLINSKKP